MSFKRVPESFLQGIFLAPNVISDPENPVHGKLVNEQLRERLYWSAVDEIAKVQFGVSVGDQSDQIKVQGMKQCINSDPYFGIGRWYNVRQERTPQYDEEDVIACQDWEVAYYRQQAVIARNVYRVRVIQTPTDIFKAEVLPTSLWGIIKDAVLN